MHTAPCTYSELKNPKITLVAVMNDNIYINSQGLDLNKIDRWW